MKGAIAPVLLWSWKTEERIYRRTALAVAAGLMITAELSSASAQIWPSRAYPHIATFAEQGYPDIQGATWFWLTAPKNLPPAVTRKLNDEARKMLKEPKVRDYFAQQALLSLDPDVPGPQNFVGSEVARWGALAKRVGSPVQ